MLSSASHHPGSVLRHSVIRPGCSLTWFLPWEPRRGQPNWFVRGTTGTWIVPLTPTLEEQPPCLDLVYLLALSSPRPTCEGQWEAAQSTWSKPSAFLP